MGYEPTKEEKVKKTFKRKIDVELKPYRKTLNGQFIKEGDNFPYYGFPEPWTHRATGKRLPGHEIFFDCKMPDYQDPYYPEESVKKLEEDWAVYLDANAMEGMLK